jgi:hypothetical protein
VVSFKFFGIRGFEMLDVYEKQGEWFCSFFEIKLSNKLKSFLIYNSLTNSYFNVEQFLKESYFIFFKVINIDHFV